MKILVLVDSLSDAGGIERVVSELINKWQEILGLNILLITKDNRDSFFKLNKDIQAISLKEELDFKNEKSKLKRIVIVLKNILKSSIKLKKILKEEDPDYIYSSTPLNTLIIFLTKFNLKNTIVAEHGSYYGYNIVYTKLKKILYPIAYKVVSPTIKDYKLYQEDGCDSVYIPNPLSLYPDEQSDLENKIVLNIGRFVKDKGHNMLLRAWNKVVSKYPNWKLKIVGDGPLKKDMEKLIYDFNLEDNVKIIPPHKNIKEDFLNSSIFVLSSRYEGFGMVLAEAMACGVPCVSFDCPSGPKNIISNNIDGILVPDQNIELLANSIIELIDNKEKRKLFGKRARNNIRRFLPGKLIRNKWKKIFRGCD